MKKIILIILSLLLISSLIFYIKHNDKENSASNKNIRKNIKITKKEEKKNEDNKKKEYVVNKDIYPKKSLISNVASDDVLPKGTVISVRQAPKHDNMVEIISDPPKGYIEKQNIDNREKYIKQREKKRNKKLTPDEFKIKTDEEINNFLSSKGGDISIYLETIDKKLTYNFYGDELKRTASCIKLPFITYIMLKATNKEIDLNTNLTYTEQFKIDGTGIIQFEPVGKLYSVEKLCELVIRYSDNVAYLMLLNYIGEQNFINYLKQLDSNSPNNRVFSNSKILSKSMKYIIENKEKNPLINKVFTWMKQTIFDDGITVGLPGVDVVHKTGWMPMYLVSNDISYINDRKNPYILTIMTVGYDSNYSEKVLADLAEIIDNNILELKIEHKS